MNPAGSGLKKELFQALAECCNFLSTGTLPGTGLPGWLLQPALARDSEGSAAGTGPVKPGVVLAVVQ